MILGSTYSKCDGGCVCDDTRISANPNYIDHVETICSPTGMELRINKCIANQFNNVKLKDLYINGNQPMTDDFVLQSSDGNNCRGYLSYSNGPQYVFTLENSFTDCNTEETNAGNSFVYTNSIQGFPAAKVRMDK